MTTTNSNFIKFINAAPSIAELAKRLHVSRDGAFESHHNIRILDVGWFKDTKKLSEEFAQYAASETDATKVALVIDYLFELSMPIDLEPASKACWKANNLESFACLNDYGSFPHTDTLLSISMNIQMLLIHCRMDIALQSKTDVPSIDLQRRVRPGAVLQAAFLLGKTSRVLKSRFVYDDIQALYDEAIAKNNFSAFKYLLISNILPDETKIAHDIIQAQRWDFVKEMCRQGFKFIHEVQPGVTAIEMAADLAVRSGNLGLLDSFFFKAGRLNAGIKEDREVLNKVFNRIMELGGDPTSVRTAANAKIRGELLEIGIPIPEITYPHASYGIDETPEERSDIPSKSKLAPVHDTTVAETDKNPPLPDGFNRSVLYKGIEYGIRNGSFVRSEMVFVGEDEAGNKDYKKITTPASTLLDEVFDGEDAQIVPIEESLGFKPINLRIAISFINGVIDKEETDCSTGAPRWIVELLGGLNVSDLIDLICIAEYLSSYTLNQAVNYFLNPKVALLSVQKLRGILKNHNSLVARFGNGFGNFDYDTKTQVGIMKRAYDRSKILCAM